MVACMARRGDVRIAEEGRDLARELKRSDGFERLSFMGFVADFVNAFIGGGRMAIALCDALQWRTFRPSIGGCGSHSPHCDDRVGDIPGLHAHDANGQSTNGYNKNHLTIRQALDRLAPPGLPANPARRARIEALCRPPASISRAYLWSNGLSCARVDGMLWSCIYESAEGAMYASTPYAASTTGTTGAPTSSEHNVCSCPCRPARQARPGTNRGSCSLIACLR